MPNDEVEELAALLAAYGLSELIEKCRAEKYTLQVLEILQQDDALSEVTPFAGQKVLLRKLVQDQAASSSGAGSSRPTGSPRGAVFSGGDDLFDELSSSPGIPSLHADLPGVPEPSGTSTHSQELHPGSSSSSSTRTQCSSADLSVPGPSGTSRQSRQEAPGSSSSSRAQSSKSARSLKRPGSVLSCASAKVSRLQASRLIDQLDVSLVLMGDECGKLIKESYEKLMQAYEDYTADPDSFDGEEPPQPPIVSENQRQKIADVIAAALLDIDQFPDHHRFPSIVSQIIDIFPNETAEAYYVPPKTESIDQLKAKGKIPNAIRNRKSRNKLKASFGQPLPSGPAAAANPDSNSSSNLSKFLKTPLTEEIHAAAKWLAHGRVPWQLVLEKWALTAPLRFRKVFTEESGDFINSYIEEWPIFDHKSGNELILQDFKLLRGNCANNLITNWDEFIDKTLKIAARDVKDKEMRVLINTAKSLNGDCLGLAVLKLLPFIRSNYSYMLNNQKVKLNVSTASQHYLLVVEKEADIKTALTARRNQFTSGSDESGGGQPLVIVVGSLKKVNSVHVSVAKLRYRVSSVAEAVDLFFKSFHVFHLQYPIEVIHILLVLQRAIYKFNTEFDSVILHSWIKIYQ